MNNLKVAPVTVEAFMASEKVALTLAPGEIPVALPVGPVLATRGAVEPLRGTAVQVSGDAVGTATIEVHLEQRGQGAPVIVLALRAEELVDLDEPGDPGRKLGYERILHLSLTDAEELVTVLQHVVKRAEG